MKFKFLPIAALVGAGCSFLASALAQTQICPVGGGTCVTRSTPASSYSSARAVDMTVRQPVPVVPTAEQLAAEVALLLPPQVGTVTSDIFELDYGTYISSIFCVYGRGADFGKACPAGSGGMLVRVVPVN